MREIANKLGAATPAYETSAINYSLQLTYSQICRRQVASALFVVRIRLQRVSQLALHTRSYSYFSTLIYAAARKFYIISCIITKSKQAI